MKRKLSILLISLIIFQSFGGLLTYVLLIQFNSYSISKLFEKKNNDILILRFSKASLINNIIKLNFKKEDEFSFEGKMYDIKQKHETKDSLIIACYQDSREDELISGFNKDENKIKNQINLLKHLIQSLNNFYHNTTTASIKLFQFVQKHLHFIFDQTLTGFPHKLFHPPNYSI